MNKAVIAFLDMSFFSHKHDNPFLRANFEGYVSLRTPGRKGGVKDY